MYPYIHFQLTFRLSLRRLEGEKRANRYWRSIPFCNDVVPTFVLYLGIIMDCCSHEAMGVYFLAHGARIARYKATTKAAAAINDHTIIQ
jgi:hypothetical protein